MLKALMLRKRIDLKKKDLAALREKLEGFKTRESELTQAIEEVETEEQRAELDQMITAFENERDEAQQGADRLEGEISQLEQELQAEEEAQNTNPPAGTAGEGSTGSDSAGTNNGAEGTATENRGGEIPMIRRLRNFTQQEREAFLGNEQVRSFLSEVRTAITEKRAITGVGLTIPEVMLGLVREETAAASKLLKFVTLRTVGGKGRMNIMGKIPEAVWTEMCANINELDLTFNQTEVDGYKVAVFVAICNATLEDSDLSLAQEIVTAIGVAIAKALDKAILFGTGSKTPVGIATRLAATSSPAWWGTNEPAFVDLHTTNIKKINKKSTRGAEFFEALVAELGIAKPVYSGDGLFWAMNRKTHLDILAKALAFNANAALVSNTSMMPILGGEIVEFEDDTLIADYEIIGGFGGNYLLAERAGVEFASSSEFRFLQDQTVFKGTGRYDGRPLSGKAFVIVNYNNTDATTSKTFPVDYANADLNDLTLTAAQGSAVGKTVVTASGTIAESNPVLKYKVGKVEVAVGDALPTGFDTLESGTTAITAAAGKTITVVELDSNNRIVSAGYVISVPKAS